MTALNVTPAPADDSPHRPVLYEAALTALAIRPDGFCIDATYGRGGHAAGIAERLGAAGRLWLVDRDPDAIGHARARFAADARVTIRHGSFAEIGGWLRARDLLGRVDGLLLDLGVSSPQLDEGRRGFSFLRPGPLDMRMDPETGLSALDWLQQVSVDELVSVLRTYGEERYARRIAAAIVAARERGALPLTTTALADLVAAAVPRREPGKHPATRTFQALRIVVNDELGQLRAVLDAACDWLAPGGRLAVISFHSLEDRAVKQSFRAAAGRRDLPREIPVIPPALQPKLRIIGKPCRAEEAEVRINPRARSATLRTAERLP